MNTMSKSGGGRLLFLTAALLAGSAAPPAAAAIENTQARSAENPSGLGDLLRQAHEAMSQGRPNVAIIYLKNAAALAPKNTGVRMELGYAYLRSGDAATAVRELRAARQAGAPDARVLPLLFEAMLARNEGQALLDQFPAPSAGDRSPLAAATFRARALALVQTAHLDLALESIDSALAINRDAPNLVVRARLARDQKDLPTALKLSEEAYSKAPNDQSVLMLRVSTLQAADKADQAIGAAGNLVKLFPGTPISLLARAGVYIQLHQDDKARADIDAVLSRWNNLPQGLYFKAILLERAKDAKGAWAAAEALPPEFVNARPELGLMVARMASAAGHKDVAMATLSAAVSHHPEALEPRLLLAAHYLRDNNTVRAIEILTPLRESQEPRAMALLGQAYAMQKEYAKSTEYFEKASSAGFGGDLLKRRIAAADIQSGDYDAAVKQLREMNAKQPADQFTAGMLITALMRSGDVNGASAVADKLAAAAPKNPYGALFQGQILLARQNIDSAIAAFSRAIALDGKFVLALYNRAIAREAKGDLTGAEWDVNAVLAADPKNTMAMIRGAEIAIRSGQDQKAQGLLQKAVASDPKNGTTSLALASYYISRKRMKDADAAISSYLKLAPNDANAQMVQAEIQLATGQADPALATFRRLAGQHPDSAQIQLMLASALVAKKDNTGALAAYKKTVQLAPKFELARNTLIRFALATGKPDEALAAALDGVKQNPGGQSDVLLATTYMALKKPDQAQVTLKQSLAQHPSEAAAVFYSQLLRQSNKVKQADAVLADWSTRHPADVGVRLELAQQQMRSNPGAAEREFRAVLQSQPKNAIALNNLSWLLQKKDPKQAVGYAEQAAQLAPNSAAVLDTLGWVKWHANDAQGALPVLQKAHAADPDNAEIAYHLAAVLDGTGRRAEAKKTLAASLSSNQNFSEKQDAEALNVKLR